MDTLPEAKKEAVRQIFRENAEAMREQFEAERQGGPIDLERLREIREETDEALKDALQEVLTDEEFEGYLKERAERMPEMRELPPLPRQGTPGANR